MHPGVPSKAVNISHRAEPPGLCFMIAMAVMLLNLKRRGGSTVRLATATDVSLAIAAASTRCCSARATTS